MEHSSLSAEVLFRTYLKCANLFMLLALGAGLLFFFAPLVLDIKYVGFAHVLWDQVTGLKPLGRWYFITLGLIASLVMWFSASNFPKKDGRRQFPPESTADLLDYLKMSMTKEERASFTVYTVAGMPLSYVALFLACGLGAGLFR